MQLLEDFRTPLEQVERELIVKAFSVNSEGAVIDIGSIYNIRAVKHLRGLYDRLDLYEEPDNPDMADSSGYLGLFYREKRQLLPIQEAELLDIIAKDNKLPAIMRIIKEIDRDNNGYVTNQELDDIFKVTYEQELGGRELKPHFKRFASI